MRYSRKKELHLKNTQRKNAILKWNNNRYFPRIKSLKYAFYLRKLIEVEKESCVWTYELYDRPLGHGGHLILFDVVRKPAWRTCYCLKS